MRFLRRIAGFLGLARDDGHDVKDQEDEEDTIASSATNNNHNQQVNKPRVFQETGLPRKGFSVPVQVAVDRRQSGPVIVPCTSGGGGVQVRFLSLSILLSFVFWISLQVCSFNIFSYN